MLERELGRGGMATVYLARDVKHDRQVAVKVLDATLAALLGADRFVHEIHVTAHLQHPHILALLDSGVFDPDAGELANRPFYVMPFVRDGSLRTRLDREGPLPISDAIRIAQGVAGALDYAHRQGVIHRDIKPENILLQDGGALVADFGIALALERVGSERLTQSGVSLGTPQYMAPEQAAGDRTITGRADIYALAAVLYESLIGEPPFTGPTAQAVAARVLTQPARSLSEQRPSVPARVDAAVRRALEKLPGDRFATAREFSVALDEAKAAPSPNVATLAQPGARDVGAGARARPRLRDPLVLALSTVAVVACGTAAWLWTRARAMPEAPTVRFVLGELPRSGAGGAPAVSPDGGTFVFARPGGGLLVRSLGSLGARSIPGTELAIQPFASPDGRWIGFFTQDDRLEKVPMDGSAPPVFVGPATRFSHGTWAPNGVIVIDRPKGGLQRIDASTGASQPLTEPDTALGEQRHTRPRVVAGGTAVVFVVTRGASSAVPTSELAFVPLDTRDTGPRSHTLLGVSGSFPVAVAEGWLVYGAPDGGGLLAVRFDANRGRVLGSSVEVLHDADGGSQDATLAPNGTLVYTHRMVGGDLVLVDSRRGARTLLTRADLGGRDFMNPRLSPDTRRVAVVGRSASGEPNVWLYDVASGTKSRLAMGGDWLDLEWSPDGKRIIFGAPYGSGNRPTPFWQAIDGSGQAERLTDAEGSFAAFAPDGRTLVYEKKTNGVWGVWSVVPGGDRVPRPILVGRYTYYMAAVSPNGHWLAYVSNESGRQEVYARPFPGPGTPVQVSQNGGTEPVWALDGRRLFYRTGREMMAVTIDDRSGFVVIARDSLFRDVFAGDMPHANYAVLPDGEHFVMFGTGSDAGPEAVAVVNWLPELRAAVRR